MSRTLSALRLVSSMDATAMLVPGAVADGAWGLPSVVVTANHSRVLLAAPEGTTRRALDMRLHLPVPTLEPVSPPEGHKPVTATVLLPAASAAAAGGLHGTIMTIADGARARVEQLPSKMLAGKAVPPLTLVGPPNTRHVVALARTFSRRDGFGLDVREVGGDTQGESDTIPQPVHADGSLAVYAVTASLSPSKSRDRSSRPLQGETPTKKRRPSPPSEERQGQASYLSKVINTMFNPTGGRPGGRAEDADPSCMGASGALISNPLPLPVPPVQIPEDERQGLGPDSINAASLPQHAVTYIVETAQTQPKIDQLRATAHGCAPGPHMRDLRDGKSVRISRPKGWIVPELNQGERMPKWDHEEIESSDLRREAKLLAQARWMSLVVRNPPGRQGQATTALKKAASALHKEKDKRVPESQAQKHVEKIADLETKLAHAQKANDKVNALIQVPMEEVTLTPEQMTEPPLPGAALVQVYLPDLAYLDSFLEEAPQVFGRYTSFYGQTPEMQIRTVIHVVHPSVLRDGRYITFAQSLGEQGHVDHVISSAMYCADNLSFPRAALGLHKVSHLDSAFFSVPPYALEPREKLKGPWESATRLDQPLFVRLVPAPHAQSVVPLVSEVPSDLAKAINRPANIDSLQSPLTFSPSDTDFQSKADAEVTASFQREMLASGATADGTKSKRQVRAEGKVEAWNEYVVTAEEVRSKISALTPPPARPQLQEITLTPLGTGSASPSRDRNVSSTLIQYDHRPRLDSGGTNPALFGAVLLDCGESTLGQLCRRLGAKRASQVLRDLRLIFVSHKHADHLLGLFRLLAARSALAPSEPVFLATCDEVFGAVQEWHAMENLGLATGEGGDWPGVHFIPTQSIRAPLERSSALLAPLGSENAIAYSPKNQDPEKYAGFWFTHSKFASTQETQSRSQALGNKFNLTLQTVPVNHRCLHAYAGIVSHQFRTTGEKWALAYSGDTLPSSALASAAKQAEVDVVLHEATMGDDMVADAFVKRHSTMNQALGVVRASGAPLAVLTHFSQRYPKLPKFSPEHDGSQGPTVALSFDLMQLKLSDAWKFPLLLSALELLYRADEEMNNETASQATEPGRPAKTQKLKNDWTYLVWKLTPISEAAPLDAQGVATAVEKAIVSMHGQVGGAIRVAQVHFDGGEAPQVVLRTASLDGDKVASALSGAMVQGYRPMVLGQAASVQGIWSLLGSGEVSSWVREEEKVVKQL